MKKFKKALSLLLCLTMVATMMITGFSVSVSAEGGKELVVYFANWDIYSQGKEAEVASLPWDKVTYINHAFFQIDKNGEGDFSISSTDPWADMENPALSEVDETLPVNHFYQYAHFSELYPDVNIMISVGGWTKCGYFSEMANTKAGRTSFINSCIDCMDTYSWIDGIDIDWEYPGVARASEGEGDEGCPVVGDDFTNYTLLLKEMREAFDAKYGAGAKKLTVCESVNYNTLAKQDCANFHQYVDLINVMTYDMTASYDPITGHQSALYNSDPNGFSADAGVQYLLSKGVPASKINIGSPLYCHGWGGVTPDKNGNVLGVPGSGKGYQGDLTWKQLKKLQNKAVGAGEPGWHYYFDDTAMASYLYNDNPDSKFYQNFLTYDSEAAIISKAQYINEKGLAGIILWEAGGDCAADNHPFISMLSNALGIYNGEIPQYTGANIQDPDPVNGSGEESNLPETIEEIEEGKDWVFTTYPAGTIVYYKGAVYESLLDTADNWSGNLPDGTWGADCWKKLFDVKPYVSQADNGGMWAYAASKGEYVLYNPDADKNADVYLALADVSNTANDAPDGIWGGSVWQKQTTILLLEAPNTIKDPVKEANVGDGSVSFPSGSQIFFNDAIWQSINSGANNAEANMPGGDLTNVYWKKMIDIKAYNAEGNTAGDYVMYNPDGDIIAPVYKVLANTTTTPDEDEANWEYVTTVWYTYYAKYADGATVSTLEADPLYFGEFKTRPFEVGGVLIESYPAGAVVIYNGKYYENYVPGSSAWDDGWEPNVHANWHEIPIKEEGDDREPLMQYPIYEIEEGKNWVFDSYPTGTLVYYKGAIYESQLDTANNFGANLPDGEWGADCWKKVMDVKPYVSQEEKGYWDYAALEGEYVLYNPKKGMNADLYLALADNSNTANDAPDGIWGGSVWQYQTTIILLKAPGSINDPINEAEVGDGSVAYPIGSQIYYKNAIWESKNANTNNHTVNMPDGTWGDGCWNKLMDVKDFDAAGTNAGEAVLYNPDNGYVAAIYKALVDTTTTPDKSATDVWEYVTTVKLAYHAKYADGATVKTLEADPLFYGEFQTRPFIVNEVEITSYPAGAVVSYNGKYYENYVDGSSAWDDGWQPDVHANWHEITILEDAASNIFVFKIDDENIYCVNDDNKFTAGTAPTFDANKRTVVPLRSIAAAVGIEDLKYDAATKKITFTGFDGYKVEMQSGSTECKLTKGSEEIYIDIVAPFTKDGSTMLPLRDTANLVGGYVKYDNHYIVVSKDVIDDADVAGYIAAYDAK